MRKCGIFQDLSTGLIFSSLLLGLFLQGCGSNINKASSQIKDATYRNSYLTANDYYAEITDDIKGEGLRNALYQIIRNNKKLSYNEADKVLAKTDRSPDGSHIQLFYSGDEITEKQRSLWNREHVWPSSRGVKGTAAYSDVHHLRPTLNRLNSIRGNKDFAEGGEEISFAEDNYVSKTTFEPKDQFKGDTARVVFYVSTRYGAERSGLDIIVGKGNSSNNMGYLCTLLKWHKDDPVSIEEENRNEKIYASYQFNRNPFIDHPEYAERIWADKCR